MKRSLLLLVLLAACGDAGGPNTQILPASFQVLAGADQIATVAHELPQVVTVKVVDASAGPVPNYPINWTALDGGQAFATVVYSGTDGIARQRWTLGTGAGTQRLVARALNPETGAVLVDDTLFATASPDVAVRITLHNADLGNPGDSTGAAIVYRDQFDNMGARCLDGGSRQRVTGWWSSDSSIAIPTGRLVIETVTAVHYWVRAIASGSVTLGVRADCIPSTATLAATVR